MLIQIELEINILCLDAWLKGYKSKIVIVHTMKACRENRCISLLIMNLDARCERPWLLYPQERSPVPMENSWTLELV
jgi:hypothetical protein